MVPHISRKKDGKISKELCASAAALIKAARLHFSSKLLKALGLQAGETTGAIMLPHISREKDEKISEDLCASAAAAIP